MSTIVSAAAQNTVTAKDIAAKTGLAYNTVKQCLSKGSTRYSASTVAKVRAAAKELGYNSKAVRRMNAKHAVAMKVSAPANPVFASRDAETAAMLQLRKTGHLDTEIAKRTGVCLSTVTKRIGHQSAAMTSASRKLAGAKRKAENATRKQLANQQLISDYNALAAHFNAKILEIQSAANKLQAMQKGAVKASKEMGVPLLRLLPPTKAC